MGENTNTTATDSATKERYGLWRAFIIVLSGHLGVRTRKQREEDFAKANGLHVLIVALTYFLVIVTALIVFVRFVSGV